MREYEAVVVLDPLVGEEMIEGSVEELKKVVPSLGGELLGVDRWGRRKLAYPIKKRVEGEYFLIRFKGDGRIVSELDRICKIREPILRHLITRVDR